MTARTGAGPGPKWARASIARRLRTMPEIASGVYRVPWNSRTWSVPMCLLIPTTTLSGSVRSCLFADAPTSTEPSALKHTTDGVSSDPSLDRMSSSDPSRPWCMAHE